MKPLFPTCLLFILFGYNNLHATGSAGMEDTSNHKQATLTLFAPGLIPTTAMGSVAPAFAPDGNTVYFGQAPDKNTIHIMYAKLKAGKWSSPLAVPFSDSCRDLEPAFSPDGKYLIFASNRAATNGGTALDGHYNNDVLPGKGGNLWKVETTKKGWGKPQLLPDIINSNTSVFSPAVAGDGSLYFMRADSGASFHIFRSQMNKGEYETPIPCSITDSHHSGYDPVVPPDESFIIWSSGRNTAHKTTDLFIAFRTTDGQWGEIIDLRDVLSDKVYGIEARLSPDCKTLYYTNSLNDAGIIVPDARFIWKVNIADLLKAHGIDKIAGVHK